MRYRNNDPDETEGRRLYRAYAEGAARLSIGLARRVTYAPPEEPKT